MFLSNNRKTLLTEGYCIKVSEFAYGKKRWAVIAISMQDERAPIVRLGEYDDELSAVNAFNAILHQIGDSIIYV